MIAVFLAFSRRRNLPSSLLSLFGLVARIECDFVVIIPAVSATSRKPYCLIDLRKDHFCEEERYVIPDGDALADFAVKVHQGLIEHFPKKVPIVPMDSFP